LAVLDEDNVNEMLEDALKLDVTKEIERRYEIILDINKEKLKRRQREMRSHEKQLFKSENFDDELY
jgi:hypothetical protein